MPDLTLEDVQGMIATIGDDEPDSTSARPAPPPPTISEAPTLEQEREVDPEWPHYALKHGVLRVLRQRCTNEGYARFPDRSLSEHPKELIERFVGWVLKRFRHEWAAGEYTDVELIVQPGSFPDVIISRKDGRLLSIEVKSWHYFAKEGCPSARFKSNLGACGPHDIILLVPYIYQHMISFHGVVRVLDLLYIQNSKYLAWYRSTHSPMARNPERPIQAVVGATPNSGARDKINDSAADDQGGNFGRVGRIQSPCWRKFAWELGDLRLREVDPSGIAQFPEQKLAQWFRNLWGRYPGSKHHLDVDCELLQPSAEEIRMTQVRRAEYILQEAVRSSLTTLLGSLGGPDPEPVHVNGVNGKGHPQSV